MIFFPLRTVSGVDVQVVEGDSITLLNCWVRRVLKSWNLFFWMRKRIDGRSKVCQIRDIRPLRCQCEKINIFSALNWSSDRWLIFNMNCPVRVAGVSRQKCGCCCRLGVALAGSAQGRDRRRQAGRAIRGVSLTRRTRPSRHARCFPRLDGSPSLPGHGPRAHCATGNLKHVQVQHSRDVARHPRVPRRAPAPLPPTTQPPRWRLGRRPLASRLGQPSIGRPASS